MWGCPFVTEESLGTCYRCFGSVSAKLEKQNVTPGEKLRYHVTVLNVGSMSAHNLIIRLQLPPQVIFKGSADVSFKKQPNGTLYFTVDHIEAGKMADINVDVQLREDSAVVQEFLGRVDVINNSLQRLEVFTVSSPVVQVK